MIHKRTRAASATPTSNYSNFNASPKTAYKLKTWNAPSANQPTPSHLLAVARHSTVSRSMSREYVCSARMDTYWMIKPTYAKLVVAFVWSMIPIGTVLSVGLAWCWLIKRIVLSKLRDARTMDHSNVPNALKGYNSNQEHAE